MALVDKALVMRKIAELELYLGQVGEFAAIGLEEYQGDWKPSGLWSGPCRC